MRHLVKYPTKLFTLMVLCFIGFNSLLLLVSGIVYYETYSKIAYREIRETKKELLDETSQKLSNYVAGIQDTARFLVTNTMVQQSLSEAPDSEYDFVTKSRQLYEEFQKLATVKEGLHSIELYTDWLKGYPAFLGQFMHPMDEADKQGWLGRMDSTDGFWIASHDYGVSGNVRMVSYVYRIIGHRGEILGIVKLNIPDKKLFEILNKRDALKDSANYYVVLDSGGNYIASVLPEGVEVIDDVDAMVREVSATKYSVIESDQNSQYWMLMQLISKDVLKQSGKEVRILIIGLLLGLIVLSIPIALWVSRKLTSPIYGIVEGMRTVEKGDFNVRMGASGIQEYLHLTTHFNRMVHRLKALIGQLNQEHRDRREAEIQLLHAQIKPHFLYNTLDLIHWRALDYNAYEISQMVQQLSKLFRIGLSNDKWYVPMRDELAHARCYMAIQEYRQNFSIEYVESVKSDLLDVIIPKIVLQPFLENAVIHGFQHRSYEKAVIQVVIEQREEAGNQQLIIAITDNGSGLPEGFDIQTTGGIGIRNVIDRIQLYCGPKYGVRVAPGERGGTQVIMNLPLINHEAEMEQLTRSLSHEYDSLG
ncbi:cache domain-containing sensor histidine kinase [Cohnella herbarum]|uniref:Sensor histidine kinase n=1 Tax=Cohnella herbarum TaxID=2728023 RepID=A0A7Z2ZM32_9BACL|nr:sensor histidine kinase [Cohnella herbarum]QJD83707.1 sensor histidine kinase [Cohnella herbarum]